MNLHATPGVRVVYVGEIALEGGPSSLVAIDAESGQPVTLVDLLRAFRKDSRDPDLGTIEISIRPYTASRLSTRRLSAILRTDNRDRRHEMHEQPAPAPTPDPEPGTPPKPDDDPNDPNQ